MWGRGMGLHCGRGPRPATPSPVARPLPWCGRIEVARTLIAARRRGRAERAVERRRLSGDEAWHEGKACGQVGGLQSDGMQTSSACKPLPTFG
jgi:hypothetical protein